MIFPLFLIILGFLLLIKGADWLILGSSTLAKKKNVSDLAIGLTIIAFGTSAPELVVNSIASFEGQSEIVFGNIIGSNLFNLLAILGIVGLIYPLVVAKSTIQKEIPISFAAIVLLYIMCNGFLFSDSAMLSRNDGYFLLPFFILFLYYVYRQMQNVNTTKIDEYPIEKLSNLKIVGLMFVGLTGLFIGGKLVVDNAIQIAEKLGLSKHIIGLTIVAAGTSLPELATSVVAAFKRNNDIAIGNIIGSNIFNIFFILSVSSLIKPITYNVKFNTDLLILAIATIFVFAILFFGKRKKLPRWAAGFLLICYVFYTINLIY